ncbi:MAG: HdeD family acid-resistance protein [Candidatus Krumholzibacteria bacterium]|nr:HdeD family acid-resistance protein [Candidatus Krumholzibacteria bacterium]MDH5271097.1 HdeD family acid-resistance protein [Candidatus Krumholzibacteria bacterium]
MNEIANAAKSAGTSATVFGVISIIAGMLCMLMPGLTGLSVITFVGVLVLVGGIARMIWAFKAGTFGRGMLVFAIGALTLLCGIVLLANPLVAAGVLTVLLAAYFIVDGIAEISMGMQRRSLPGAGWLIFGGVVSILLGIMMWRQFPLSGTWAIGVLLGIKLFFVGILMVTGGSAIRSIAKAA